MLREPARDVVRVTKMHRRLIKDMFDTMRDAPGVGLAAPQVGVMERVFVWEVEENRGAFINPRIVWRSDETIEEEEGCLSLPGLAYPVERAVAVRVDGLDERGRGLTAEADNLMARVYQHEIDHLDGVLFIDRLPGDVRRDALRTLREQALGLAPAGDRARSAVSREESL